MASHRGVEYEVELRVTDNDGAAFTYDFVLQIDGEEVMTADQLDQRGYDGPAEDGLRWKRHLIQYAEAYIDGHMDGF